MTRMICRWLAFVALASLPPRAAAHHSVAEFDLEKPMTLNATVKEMWFSNPHIRYCVTVTGENGAEPVWDVHGSSVTSLARRGWTKDTIKVGDKIHVNCSPAPQAEDGVKNYNPELDQPALRCVSPGLAALFGWAYPFEIVQTKNEVILKTDRWTNT